MMKSLIVLLGSVAAADHCCGVCPEGQIKTYSIDKRHGMCGEGCCFDKDFWKYHIFESGLMKADSNNATVCHDLGYSNYDSTQTHGIPHILSITVDLYKPDNATISEPAPEMEAFLTA